MNATARLLLKRSYWILSEVLFEELGLLKAFVLTELISKYSYYEETEQLYEGEWFFYRREDMLKRLDIQPDTQRKILKELAEMG